MLRRKKKSGQSGQSMIEFAFLVPLIVIFLGILVEVELAINAAIVNNKYSAMHLRYLFFNHRVYPERKFLPRGKGTFMRRFWVGVQDRANDTDPNRPPLAPTIKIGRVKPGEDDTPGEVSKRQNVRIKVSAFTCVPPVGLKRDEPFSEGFMREDTFFAPGPDYCGEGD